MLFVYVKKNNIQTVDTFAIGRKHKIKTFDDIEGLANYIKDYNDIDNVVILNWKELR